MSNPIATLIAEGPQKPKVDPWKIRAARTHRGWEQAELAEAMRLGGGGESTVSRYECYALPAGRRTLAKLCKALNLAEKDLQSNPREFAANRLAYAAWREAGNPDLTAWLREHWEKLK